MNQMLRIKTFDFTDIIPSTTVWLIQFNDKDQILIIRTLNETLKYLYADLVEYNQLREAFVEADWDDGEEVYD